jgi:uncharacterized protein (UPF0333 family)
MDNKMVALIVIILVLIVGAVYLLANTGNTTQNASANTTNITGTTNNNTTPTVNNETISKTNTTNNTTNNTANVKISAKQAQQIAVGAEKDLTGKTVTAGTPTLFKWTANNLHTWVWNVPLYDTNGASAGEIDVDAYTGEVIMNE